MTQQDFILAVPILRTQMLHTASRYLTEPCDREDVVQEVLVSLWDMRERFISQNDIQRYAATAVRNTSLNLLRSHHRHPTLSLDDGMEFPVHSHDDSATQDTEQHQQEYRLQRAVDALSECDRALVRMRNIQDMPYNDIARILGISEAAVRTRICRIRTFLIKQIKP